MFIFVFIVHILFALGAVLATAGASSGGVTSTVSDESLEKIIALFQSQLQQDLLNASEKVTSTLNFDKYLRFFLICLTSAVNDHPWVPKIVATVDRWSLFRGNFVL